MPRYFLELAYKGTPFNGFQVQQNANTVQAEVERAANILLGEAVTMTGSSRTDAGVHAKQNYFHFDLSKPVEQYRGISHAGQLVYKLNAILPAAIAVRGLQLVRDTAHCRFDAVRRSYRYSVYAQKDPFLDDRAYYYPYKLQMELMAEAAALVMQYRDFTSFSKRNTQVKSFICVLEQSEWVREERILYYKVAGNRFLRGMVRALTATMLKLGRGHLSLEEFREIIESRDCTKASFAVPARGLCLEAVDFPEFYFESMLEH